MSQERWYHKPLPVAIISSLVSIAITSAGGVLYAYMSHGQLVRQLGATTPDTIGTDIKKLSSDPEKFKVIADIIHQYSNKVDDISVRTQVVEAIRNLPSNSDFVREIVKGVNSRDFFMPLISIIDVALSESSEIDLEYDRDRGMTRILRYICDGKIECRIYPFNDDVFHEALREDRNINRNDEDYSSLRGQVLFDALNKDQVAHMHVYYRCGSGKDIRNERFLLNSYIIIKCE